MCIRVNGSFTEYYKIEYRKSQMQKWEITPKYTSQKY